jgi:hypothetical protein
VGPLLSRAAMMCLGRRPGDICTATRWSPMRMNDPWAWMGGTEPIGYLVTTWVGRGIRNRAKTVPRKLLSKMYRFDSVTTTERPLGMPREKSA